MLVFSMFLFSILLTPFSTFGQKSCSTPTRSIGTCIPYRQCTFLTTQLQSYGSNLPEWVANYLRQAQCNSGDSSTIYLCCDVKFNSKFATSKPGSVPTRQSSVTRRTKLNQSNNNFNNFATPAPTSPTFPSQMISFQGTASKRLPLNNAPAGSPLNSRGLSILNGISCGPAPDDKISFGERANLGEFPWMALLRYASNIEFQCGGSLITQRYVLTAAHCVLTQERLIGVRLGEHDLSTEPDCLIKGPPRRQIRICVPPAEDYGIERVIPHASYRESRIVNDIALIKLDRRVGVKKHIVPICLPVTQQSQNTRLLQTLKLIIAGWGTTQNTTGSNVLMKAKIPLLDNSVCQRTFPYITFTSNHICAGGELRVDNCKGDSGGPLFVAAPYREKDQYIQYGIISAGVRSCGSKMTFPGIYTNVIDLLPWITTNIDE